MKTSTIKLLSVLVILLVSFFQSIQAQVGDIVIKPGQSSTLQVQGSSSQQLVLENSVAFIRTLEVNTDRGPFTKLIIPGYSKSYLIGSPEVPVKRQLIEVPLNADPLIEIINSSYKEFNLAELGYSDPLFPAQPPMIKDNTPVNISYDLQAYSQDEFYPSALATIDILGIMRSTRIGRVNISPVQYNPVTHILRVYDNLVVRIIFRNADLPATIDLKKKYDNFTFSGINRCLINYQPFLNRDTLTEYPITYAIISDPMFESQLQPFIQWLTKRGFNVITAYTDDPNVGNTTYSIKNYIESLYNSKRSTNDAPSFVLFVGDIQQIPAWNGDAGSHVTDLYYCEFTGDYFPEIYYGRFSAQNPDQLQPYIDKTIQYESYKMPDPSYLNDVVMIAGMDGTMAQVWANGQINYGTENYFNESNGITSHTYLYPESGSHAADIIQNVSDGVTFANYTAHGSSSGWADPPFSIGDIATLQNQDKYGVLVGNACLTSKYDDSECFAEALLRAENKGAVGYIGGSNSTYWDEDYYFGVGFKEILEDPPPYDPSKLGSYDRLFHTHSEQFIEWYVTMAQEVFAGNIAVTEGSPGSALYYWEIYNVMGDPSLMNYFSVPASMDVSYLPLLPLGTNTFIVYAEPYAYVGISMNGILHGAALCDGNGAAVIPITPFTVPGIGDVVVTKQNREPYIGTVIVANPEGPFVILNQFQANEISGNINNKLESGEVISLDVELKNYGNSDGENIQASLTTQDPYITVADPDEPYGTILAQSTAIKEDAFSFIVGNNIPDGHTVQFSLNVENPLREIWTSEFTIQLSAPVLSIEQIKINDSETGNGNNRLDPGETAKIILICANRGHSIAYNAYLSVEAHSGFITVSDPTYFIGNLGLFGNTQVAFDVQVSPDASDGVIFTLLSTLLADNGFELAQTTPIEIGLVDEDFETGNFNSYPWVMGGNKPWVTTITYPFEGNFSIKSGAIIDGQSSEIELTYDVMTPDSISFYRKVSSETGDKLKFFINDDLKAEWSGTTQGWRREAFAVGAGIKTFKWAYVKDGSTTQGADCGWLDYILFPPPVITTAYAGPDGAVCSGNNYQVYGITTNADSFVWTTSGTGTFNNSTFLNPVYTPSTEDITTGSVNLTFTVTGQDEIVVSDMMLLSLIETAAQPEIPSGPDYINLTNTLVSDYTTQSVANSTSYSWSVAPPEAGTLINRGVTGTIVWDRDFTGEASIQVSAVNICGAGQSSEPLVVTVENSGVGIAEPSGESWDVSAYPNPADNVLYIRINGTPNQDLKIRLVNLMGKNVFNVSSIAAIKGSILAVGCEKLAPGLYILVVADNMKSFSKKIVLK